MLYARFLFSLMISFAMSQYCFSQTIENGVSENLAKSRKEHITNLSYTLHLRISPSLLYMPAEEEIHFDYGLASEPLQIDFKVSPHRISALWVNGQAATVNYQNEHLIIPATQLRSTGNEVTIHFASSGNAVKIDTNGLVYTLLVPAKAREVFPCFDQPDLKAVFSLKLTIPREWVAVSNAAVIDSALTPADNTITFAPTQPISTYLFAFAAGKFSKYSEEREGRTINFYYQETDRAKIDSSLVKCVDLNFRALDYLSGYLGMAYPFSKFDFVEIPRFSVSGMEHPGAIFYNGRTLFMDAASATEEFARANTIGHEVSHMWFGDDVTMKWFNDVWLKEVFANYLGNRFASSVSPQKDLKKKSVLSNYPAAYSVDRYPSSEPINRNLPNLNQAGLVYGSITYNKAPIAIHQLALLMGEDAFRRGLQEYVRTFKGGNADFSELMSVFQNNTSADLNQFSKSWIDQPGRPVIGYVLDTAQGKITKLTFTQRGEWNKEMLWPQRFEILLAFADGTFQSVAINLTSAVQDVPELIGKKAPRYIVFNSSGEGYGIFPIDKNILKHFDEVKLPEARAASVINLFERMLAGKHLEEYDHVSAMSAEQLLRLLLNLAATEPDKQILERELNYIQAIYWRYLNSKNRQRLNAFVENSLLETLQQQSADNRTPVYRTFIRIAESKPSLVALYDNWNTRSLPAGVIFGSNDWNHLARELAVRNYRATEVLRRQRDSITDAVTRRSFAYLMPALSPDVAVRDSFFNSILAPGARLNDSDVAAAISWLHHPLQQRESVRYIAQALAVLPDVLNNGDIFFPSQWIGNMLDNYASPQATKILNEYLSHPHPDIPPLLLQKVKQAADGIRLANEIAMDDLPAH